MTSDNLVDVMAASAPSTARVAATRIDYSKANDLFAGVRFIHECGQKLGASCTTVATASVLFHKFFKVAKKQNHDQYLVATACLYVSGKLEEHDQQLKIRDLINVVHSTLHRSSEPLGLDSQYYNMRENICQAELLVLRMVGFKTTFDHPHKYLLHYLMSLRDWLSEEVWAKYPISRVSWAILQDFYHDPRILDVVEPSLRGGSRLSGDHFSLACIYLALQTYGLTVPYVGEGDGRRGGSAAAWFNAFSRDLSKEKLVSLATVLMEVYLTATTPSSALT